MTAEDAWNGKGEHPVAAGQCVTVVQINQHAYIKQVGYRAYKSLQCKNSISLKRLVPL
jgi:hypothetical protein